MKIRQLRNRRRERLVVLRFRFLILEKSRNLAWLEQLQKMELNCNYGGRPIITSGLRLYDSTAHTKLQVNLEAKPVETPKEPNEPGVIPTGVKDQYAQLFEDHLAKRRAAKQRYVSYIKMFGPNIVSLLRHEDEKGLFDRYYPKKKELESA